jgi:hypothetical protein
VGEDRDKKRSRTGASMEKYREVLCDKSTLLGSVLVLAVFSAASGVAAPAVKPRANRTILNPTTSTPVWVSSDTATRSDVALAEAVQVLRVASIKMEVSQVIVPSRPPAASPFVTPLPLGNGALPPWILGNNP